MKKLLPKDFIKDLERIFEAAIKKEQYTAALAAKKIYAFVPGHCLLVSVVTSKQALLQVWMARCQ